MMGTRRSFVAVAAVVLVGSAAPEAQAPPSGSEMIRARQQMAAVESAFERAISVGAQLVIDQLRAAMPGWKLTSVPRADGFRLPGHGVVVNVLVPDLQPPLRWELQQITQEPPPPSPMALQQMRTYVSTIQGPQRVEMERYLLEMEQRLATGNARATNVGRGSVSAASVVQAVPPGQRPADPRVVDDPDDAYTREVKGALIDAMLKQTQVLSLGADETLTIFARTSAPPDPLLPADSSYLSSWVLSVKGSTLAAFRAGKLTEQEAIKLVEVLEQ